MSFPGFMSPVGDFASRCWDTIQKPFFNGRGEGSEHATPSARKNNQFAQLYLNNFFESGGGGGMIFSPFSIYYIMQLVYLGSSGQTREELGKVLGQSGDADMVKDMIRVGKELVNTGKMNLANGFFIQGDYYSHLKGAFHQLIQKVGQIERCEFRGNAAGLTRHINNWVAENTQGLIQELLSEDNLDDDTLLVLVNVIYFKANWLNQFNKEDTRESGFTQLRGSIKVLPMMYLSDKKFLYYDDERVQILSMLYQNQDFCMDVFLPRGNFGKKNLLDMIQSHTQYDLDIMLSEQKVDVYFPKFTQRSKTNLTDFFQKMGARRMFMPEQAEFENMMDKPVGNMMDKPVGNMMDKPVGNIYISDIIHEAVVIVDEEGTEAAAATSVVMKNYLSLEKRTKVFRADHTFLYQIRHRTSGMILFQGVFDGE